MSIPSRSYARVFATTSVAVASALLMACGERPGPPPAGPGGPPEVAVVVVQPQRVSITTELPGRTAPYQVAEIRPQVSGLIQARPFREGSDVKAGETLYRIDPALYQAAYDNAVAALVKAEANLRAVRLKADRYRELGEIKAVAQQDVDDSAAALQQAQADVTAGRAAVETNRINLAYTRLSAPISGRIGRSTATPGALVNANQAAALATVQQLDPIHVDVTQSSAAVLRLKHALARGELKAASPQGAAGLPVKLLLEDGTAYPIEGRLQFSEALVEASTGAITLRAVFPNPKQELLPGMYVRAVIEEGVNERALLVPQVAVSRDSAGKAVAFVVGADGKLEQRVLETERTFGDRWLVTAGIQPGERLVVDGLQGARPGAAVKAVAQGTAPAQGVRQVAANATPQPDPEAAGAPPRTEGSGVRPRVEAKL